MSDKSISKLLIANRGEIAVRVIKTARAMGIRTIAVYSEADEHALFVELADEAYLIGPANVSESYLQADKILEVAKQSGANAIHPGYGFLSENADFADKCAKAGIIFVGPTGDAIRAMGLKDKAKALMTEAGVPVVPGYHGASQDEALLAKEAERIGYPVLIKAVSGGGGKGMRRVDQAKDFSAALKSAQSEGQSSFGDPRVLIEKYIEKPRHIEIQVFADSHGNAVHLFERDCSLQRRHQKVVEEAPAPSMSATLRTQMGNAAVKAAKAISYQGAGTIEFIVDVAKGLEGAPFYFMEMNTRLQVEHPVTEAITGTDLVEWQLRVARGEKLPKTQDELQIQGHAFEVRLYAEDPDNDFLPAIGRLKDLRLAEGEGTRIDTGVRTGDEISIFYDPMIAKVITYGETREAALSRMAQALDASHVMGLATNKAFLSRIMAHDAFRNGDVDTGFIPRYLDELLPAKAPISDEHFVMAALGRLLDREQRVNSAKLSDPTSPWHYVDGWRMNLPAAETLRFTRNSEHIEIGIIRHD
ncbi:MAG: acetyl/propionyl/methylcrotonyl-CoA carboxylase subunit alpha, partial [Sphingomonadales bacterium]